MTFSSLSHESWKETTFVLTICPLIKMRSQHEWSRHSDIHMVSFPDYFSHAERKNSLVNCLFNFVPCDFKIGDTTSSKMYYVTSHKAWNYERALKRWLVAGIILLGAPERQETKIHKTWGLCQPQVALRQFYRHLKASGTSHCQFSSSDRNTHHPFTEILAFLHRSFSGSTRLSLLHSASTALPSLIAIYCSTWHHLCEAIWLERHEHGTWNKNWIGSWPDYFSPLCAQNSLGTRLVITCTIYIYA